jgi:hypothetical protein
MPQRNPSVAGRLGDLRLPGPPRSIPPSALWAHLASLFFISVSQATSTQQRGRGHPRTSHNPIQCPCVAHRHAVWPRSLLPDRQGSVLPTLRLRIGRTRIQLPRASRHRSTQREVRQEKESQGPLGLPTRPRRPTGRAKAEPVTRLQKTTDSQSKVATEAHPGRSTS